MVVGVAPGAVLLDSNTTVYFETDAAVVMVTGAVVLMSSTASPSVAMMVQLGGKQEVASPP